MPIAWIGPRGRRASGAVMLLALLAASVDILIGDVDRTTGGRGPGEDGFGLFAVPRLVLASNQLQCVLTNGGDVCAWSPDLGGGGWFPTGSPDEYIFNSGVQIAGITDSNAGAWSGDTIGAFLVDLSGGGKHATELTPIYDSRDPADFENWPQEAYVTDSDIFAPILLGRKTASLHDTWVQYWDGDPAHNARRSHPMGVRVNQRSMSWTYPSGNESIVYFVFEFENVTNDTEFQRLNELAFFGGENELPDEGWSYDDVYIAVTVDNDVGFASQNFSTAILPFDMGIAYHGGFNPPSFWQFPPSVFFPPFFTRAPGIAGIKYLKSPTDPSTGEEIGLSMHTNLTLFDNSRFPDAKGSEQLWRYLAGRFDLGAGDPPCNIAAEIQTLTPATTRRSVCFVPNNAADIRYYQASGPFRLAAGEASTVVAAWLMAPTVRVMPDGSPSGIVANTTNKDANPPGVPSFHPGFPSARGCDTTGNNCTDLRSSSENEVQPILRGAGWVSYAGPPPAGTLFPSAVEHPSNSIDQFQVRVVPGSLLGRALVAQTVFNNQFLLGFAPEAPAFYLVPGDDNVTVLWQPSSTEVEGDPFFEVAGDTTSAVYNPNYRQFDVEGYRIWRGTQRGQLDLIAQFDYERTRFEDFTCETVHPEEDVGVLAVSPETGDTIPVIGYAAGEICPASPDDSIVRRIDAELVFNNGGPGGPPGGGVSRMPTSAAVDTAILADRDIGPVQPLRDQGVPFVYFDHDVVDNFTYFYSVTAFDVNSMASGPHSLRSAKIDQTTVPRADAPNLVGAELQVVFTGDDGTPLNPSDPMPTLDPETGMFLGPMPPTNRYELSFAPLLPRLLPQLQLQVVIDSVQGIFDEASDEGNPTAACPLGGSSFEVCEYVWMSYTDVDDVVQVIKGDMNIPWWTGFGSSFDETTANWVSISIPFDQDALDSFDIPAASGLATVFATGVEAMNTSAAEGPQNRRSAAGGNSIVARLRHGGSRWFSGPNESTPDPTAYMRVGSLAGVDTVWAPISHTPETPGGGPPGGGDIQFEKQCFNRANSVWARQADLQVVWGEGGTITVRDLTHHVDVPFNVEPNANYGFVQDANGNGLIDWQDFNGTIRVFDQINIALGGGECDGFNGGDAQFNIPAALPLTQTATLTGVTNQNWSFGWADPANGYTTWTAIGQGFGFYINSERFIFQVAAIPAAGTTWNLRSYTGGISSDAVTFDSADPSGYNYNPTATTRSAGRPILIPGIVFNWLVEDATNFSGPTDLTLIHTVPDPYLATSRYDLAPSTKQLMFVNVPPVATIRIYTLTGVLVDIVNHDDVTGGGRAVWNLRNRNNQFVASGVYFFHVATPDGVEHVGKFTVINRASG